MKRIVVLNWLHVGSLPLGLPLFAAAGCSVSAAPGAPAAGPPAAGCAQDDSVSCQGNATGYSCNGADSPDADDPSLACSDGLESGGVTEYCCVIFSDTSCQVDSTVQGCAWPSYGFSCTGTDSPDEADGSLTCSSPTSAGGLLLYCCTN